MYKAKTIETDNSVIAFIQTIKDEQKQADCFQLIELMNKMIGLPAKLWGTAIIGFGSYHYKYASGHEGDAPPLGFSPRKNALSIYLSCEALPNTLLFSKLGKHKMAKACLSIKKLSDIDLDILKSILINSMDYTKKI